MSTFTSELYRNAEGAEVWRILQDGQTVADEIASDHDWRAILDSLTDEESVEDDPFSGLGPTRFEKYGSVR